MDNFEKIRKLVLSTDNKHCFIERDAMLKKAAFELKDYDGADKFARALKIELEGVSTPIEDCDYFAGRVVEGPTPTTPYYHHGLMGSIAHLTLDYPRLLSKGLCGILEEINQNAEALGDEESLQFAKNCEIVVFAIRDYALRYSFEAEKIGKTEMAKALKRVPFEPAYDFYSALQSVWLIHMIASCYVGGRDYAFGRFDKTMLPYYNQAIDEGLPRDTLVELFAGFMIKTNEICGRAAHNYDQKPIPCNSSKQYMNIGGPEPNEMSMLILDAAMLAKMPQPQITVLLKPDANAEFTDKVFTVLSELVDSVHIYNHDLVLEGLIKKGVPENVANEFCYSGCCTFDLGSHSLRREYYVPVPQIFQKVLRDKEYNGINEILAEFKKQLGAHLQERVEQMQSPYPDNEARKQFVLDGILFADSYKRCRYFCDGESPYNALNLFCPGIATIGDSLMVLDKLIFTQKRFTYRDFINILDNDWQEFEELRQEILNLERFGNDGESDDYTVLAANTFIEVTESLNIKENFYAIPAFYSLNRDNEWRNEILATPDGRKAFTRFSENQSPTYSADKKGVTLTLKSVAKLPFDMALAGGLNLTFMRKIEPEILKGLTTAYFGLGGLHIGTTVIDRETLIDAMKHPENHQTLTVRLYGFSEYFVCLADWQQEAILARTEHNI